MMILTPLSTSNLARHSANSSPVDASPTSAATASAVSPFGKKSASGANRFSLIRSLSCQLDSQDSENERVTAPTSVPALPRPSPPAPPASNKVATKKIEWKEERPLTPAIACNLYTPSSSDWSTPDTFYETFSTAEGSMTYGASDGSVFGCSPLMNQLSFDELSEGLPPSLVDSIEWIASDQGSVNQKDYFTPAPSLSSADSACSSLSRNSSIKSQSGKVNSTTMVKGEDRQQPPSPAASAPPKRKRDNGLDSIQQQPPLFAYAFFGQQTIPADPSGGNNSLNNNMATADRGISSSSSTGTSSSTSGQNNPVLKQGRFGPSQGSAAVDDGDEVELLNDDGQIGGGPTRRGQYIYGDEAKRVGDDESSNFFAARLRPEQTPTTASALAAPHPSTCSPSSSSAPAQISTRNHRGYSMPSTSGGSGSQVIATMFEPTGLTLPDNWFQGEFPLPFSSLLSLPPF